MTINFEKIIIKNFLSFGYSELDLKNKGYCLVTGENHFKKDNALSNGSGKSTIWSAISYALTGETIQGLSSNLYNINVEDEEQGYVILYFNFDGANYEIQRIFKPKNDLKIKVNNEDKSGKGIREGEKILSDLLPDINADLLKTSIIIGQGMPCKFSSFSPSGRKELLEKLTKSDFMIEDVKNRIANRQVVLGEDLRQVENNNIQVNAKIDFIKNELEKINNYLSNLTKPDFDKEIDLIQNKINSINTYLKEVERDKLDVTNELSKAETELSNIKDKKQVELNNQSLNYNENKIKLNENKSNINSKISVLKNDINKLKSIKDICPTCGQKIPGIIKPDTSKQEEELAGLAENLNICLEKIKELDNLNLTECKKINKKYDDVLTQLNTQLQELKQSVTKYDNLIKKQNNELLIENTNLTKLINQKDNYEKDLKEKLDRKSNYENNLKSLEVNLQKNKQKLDELQLHVDVLNKMNTLTKRDFRGYLLENIISFINIKAKEYSMIVFETNDLDVSLSGNSLDIKYCNKLIENLSGGEQQRVDLILQFAIRDMMTTYLNFNCNIIALDEIFDALDRLATDRILDLITNKLTDIESVFIISHHADSLQIPMDTEIKVIKDEYGISNII